MDIYKEYPRRFLAPADDLGNPDTVRTAYAKLETLEIDTEEKANAWSDAWNEVQSAVSEVIARAYFAATRDTSDKEAEAEYGRLADEIIPLREELDEKAKRRFLEIPEEWVPDNLGIARQEAKWAVELFRESNLPLITENIKYRQQYQKITSEWITEFDGKKLTRQQLIPYLESKDRWLRERAWHAMVKMHLEDY
jgi:oligoendopeptidase F